ncbi:MAG: hypothetical protein ABII02_01300 [Candidatus Magasanikbacteria bacterium]
MSKKLPDPECCPFLDEDVQYGFNAKCLVTGKTPTQIFLRDGRGSIIANARCCRPVVALVDPAETMTFKDCADYSRTVYGLTRERIKEAIEKHEPIHEIVQATLAKELLRLINRVVGGEEK